MESILTTTKLALQISEDDDSFDSIIIMHINSVFSILHQLGIGPPEGFSITDDLASWSDLIADATGIELVKTYVSHKVKMIFDPPSNSAAMEAMNRQIGELEWRLAVAADSINSSTKEAN